MDAPAQTGVSKDIRSSKSRLGRYLRNAIISLILAGIAAVYGFFFNVYSNGERKGMLIKITHKGNIFKTNEGEMWLSCRQTMNPEKFFFSVTNDSLANLLKNLQDECVQVSYIQYRSTLPWRGESKYLVTGVVRITRED